MRNKRNHIATPGRVLILATVIAVFGVFLIQRASAGSVDANNTFELGDGVNPLVPGVGDVTGDPLQPGPDWNDLFAADRTVRDDVDEFGQPGSNGMADYLDLNDGYYPVRRDAGFVIDDISAGGGLDSTIFVAPGTLGSGSIAPDYDIGNAYAYGAFDASKNLILYAGVERLVSGAGSIVFEFNKDLFSIQSGTVVGQRSDGDLRVQADFPGGVLTTVGLSQWGVVDAGTGAMGWIGIEVLPISPSNPAEQCNAAGTFCVVCNGTTVNGGDWTNYDETGTPITDLSPNSFMEFGINLSAALGIHRYDNYYDTRYASIQVSTNDGAANPVDQDFALGSFDRAEQVATSRR